MSHARSTPQPAHLIAATLVCLFLLVCIQGCPSAQPAGLNTQLLPGVWRSPQDGFDIVWTFAADGGLRWQLQPKYGQQFLSRNGNQYFAPP